MAGGVGEGLEILLRTGIRGMNDENIPALHLLEAFARLEHGQGTGEPPYIEFLFHGRNDTRQEPASPAPTPVRAEWRRGLTGRLLLLQTGVAW